MKVYSHFYRKRRFISSGLLLYLLVSCALLSNIMCTSRQKQYKTYENPAVLRASIGDTVRIYYATNSCCRYCLLNASALRHTQYIDNVLVENSEDGCVGCNATYAFWFLATEVGTDTIYCNIATASAPCNDTLSQADRFIIEVTPPNEGK
ncbi:MAG: hypothetical protein RIS47_2314 [Bacteroidota bacterium]|jgi:hypothetical protein